MSRCRHHGDDGSVAAYFVVALASLWLFLALVVDGGRVLTARRDAHNVALEAARLGVLELDPSTAYTGSATGRLDPIRAESAARAYLTEAGWSGSVTTDAAAGTVRVHVTGRASTAMLAVIGVDSIGVDGDGAATAVLGNTTIGG
jgi:Flp pilus assembly protein TadG